MTVRRGTATILDEVSLGLSDGDRIGVVGRNGAGKSTLLRTLAGDDLPDAGRVTCQWRVPGAAGHPARRPARRDGP